MKDKIQKRGGVIAINSNNLNKEQSSMTTKVCTCYQRKNPLLEHLVLENNFKVMRIYPNRFQLI